MRQRGCRNDRRVGDLHVVVQFITFFQTTQNRNGIFNGRLRHEYFLETTFQRGVFLNVLAIFIQRRSAHAVQLTARQRRFQHVTGVHCAVRFTRTHHGVQLIDKQDDVAFLLGEVIQNAF